MAILTSLPVEPGNPKRPFRRVQLSESMWFWMSHLQSHPDTEAHDHTCLELAFIMSGRTRHITVRGTKVCHGGTVLIIPPGAWHGYAECSSMEIYNCLLSSALLQNELAWAAHDNDLASLLPSPLTFQTEITELNIPVRILPQLQDTLAVLHQSFLSQSATKAQILGQLLLLLHLLSSSARKVKQPPAMGDIHPSVRQALLAFQRDIAYPWTLSNLAAELRITPSYLVRLFQNNLGLAPMKLLANRRAELAATFLLTGKLSIGEIGERVGWPDPKQFARSFRQYHHINARDYRKRMLDRFAAANGSPAERSLHGPHRITAKG
jgi:AraC family transcriptional regulator, L-rhamnose operon transcriptional activator RhaR